MACIAIAWIVTRTVTTREMLALGAVLLASLVMYVARRGHRPA
jgi:hypothetical protein